MEKFLFLMLCLPLCISAQIISLTQTAVAYLSDTYGDTRAQNIAIDEGRKFVYVTGGEYLNIFKLASGDSLKPLKTQLFNGTNLGAVKWCGNFITIVMKPQDDPAANRLDVFKVYNKKAGLDMVAVNSVPLGPSPGMHRHSADCKTVIAPIGALPYTNESSGMEVDDDGLIKIITFKRANLADTYTVTDLDFGNFIEEETRLISEGGLIEQSVSFVQGLEPAGLCMNVNETKAYVVLQSNNMIATVDLATQTITALKGLGFRDLRQFGLGGAMDTNDRNGIDISNYPIQAAFNPSRIECIDKDGNDWLITVNEGMPLYKKLVKLSDVTLDPLIFTNTSFQDKDEAGRLFIWPGGDVDGDGDCDVVIVPGARGVAMFYADTMVRVEDSNDQLETNMALSYPDLFNADPKTSDRSIGDSFDKRSNNRGPEPKSLAMFSVCNDRYWFVVVGMQVPGGLAVWSIDITEANPFFTFQAIHQEVNNYNTSSTWGDLWANQDASLLSVDGLTLYPGRSPVLLAASSVSSTVDAFKLRVSCSG